MRVAYVTPEVLPYSKTGGLADVSQALPAALVAQGVDCTVFTPFYRQARERLNQQGQRLELLDLRRGVWIGNDEQPLSYARLANAAVPVVFVVNDWYYDRPHCYLAEPGDDYDDNVARFAFLCRAVLEYCLEQDEAPDVFHVHDWQSALIPVYLKTIYRDRWPAATSSLLTIHNLGYPGLFAAEHLFATGLDWSVFTLDQLEYYGKLNLLKGGIVFADAVTTVSPSYAAEIQTPEFGHGLDGVLSLFSTKLSGILNGIDEQHWNPATDPHLRERYSQQDFGGKRACKRALQREMGLPLRARTLLLGVISRLDRQKGIRLLLDAFPAIAGQDLQLAILGTGEPALERELQRLAEAFPEQVAVRLSHDEPLAHRIIAGADAFVMPSLYEPCGLTQMYSQRYGTIPIVRATGGLRDTVADYRPGRGGGAEASGFSFGPAEAGALAGAIKRAAKLYFTDRRSWNRLARRIMALDHSWQRSASAYAALYQSLAEQAGSAAGGVGYG